MNKAILFLVSRGLLEHKERMREAIWEYLWFVDRVTKDVPDGKGKFNGLVLGGSPVTAAQVAGELKEHLTTAKRNIRCLEYGGYIIRTKYPDNSWSVIVTNSKKWFWNREGSDQKCSDPRSENAPTLGQGLLRPRSEDAPSNKERHDSDKTKDKKKRPSAFDPTSLELPPWLPKDLWLKWCQHRKEINKPLRSLSAKESIAALDRYRRDGHQPGQVIDHCVASGYQGLFPPKEKSKNATNGNVHQDASKKLQAELARVTSAGGVQ